MRLRIKGRHGESLPRRRQAGQQPMHGSALLQAPGAPAPEPLPQRTRTVQSPPWASAGDTLPGRDRAGYRKPAPLEERITDQFPVIRRAPRTEAAVAVDERAPAPPVMQEYPAVPPAPVTMPARPDISTDLSRLPLFRDTLARRTRCSATECLCGHRVGGDAWGERMVRAGIHLLDPDAARILADAGRQP